MVFPQLKQKIVLVIGGAQGIGAAVRRTFLTESAVVIDADRQYKDTFSQTSANAYQCFLDICEEASVLRLRDELVKRQLVP
ncbi:SDR family NAD(P)-dependent oxidoreductase, partial [Listeria monocytogenes]|nr:SDR family NAD(P)-dependent oxidoreductase [Listeria monocytogenes]